MENEAESQPRERGFTLASGSLVAFETGELEMKTWQGMTNAEHLADCERLEAERKAREAVSRSQGAAK